MISSFLWRLFGWIRYRALWVTLGVVALCLLIWFAGPLIAFADFRPLESVKARCWFIGIICAYLLLRYMLRRWYASRMNSRLADMLRSALAPGTGQDESAERIGMLHNRFSEALDVLRKARFERTKASFWSKVYHRGRYVYELPWYVIIGAPGVGKTTALLNSGLSFPLAKHIGAAAIHGAGGTRHCDWWFTNEAVFIDTAGRYTTHETDAKTDKIEWRGFLSLLKKTRSRQPINGVFLMLSVSDLLGLSADERQTYATTLRNRLDELHTDLGMIFPVYLLLNKCDLLLGFNEYFSTLDRAGREQVWGFTLPFFPSGKFELNREKLTEEFNELQKRINRGLINVLQGETDLRRRELIYTFPQQFSMLSLILGEIVKELFSTSRFSKSPLLRGVYFTSATQEGTPLDRIVNVLGQDFPIQRPHIHTHAVAKEGKAFFIQELLTKVVFSEAHIAGTDRRAERKSRAYHVAAYSLSIGLLGAAALAWVDSYQKNLTYIAEVDKKTIIGEAEFEYFQEGTKDNNIYSILPYLNMAENLPDSIFFKNADPQIRWTFGLYQGKKLKAGARPLYHHLLSRYFVPVLKTSIEHWLKTVDINDMELSYEILKAYIMMHENEHFEREEFIDFIEAMWGSDYPAGTLIDERSALARHLNAAIDFDMIVPVTPIDITLVHSTRSRLTQYTNSQRFYHRILRTLKDTQLPEFSVSSESGVQGAQVFAFKSGRALSYGVPALYTYRGYHELFKPGLDHMLSLINKDDSWVLGTVRNERGILNDILTGKLTLDIKRHYMLDYISYWESYISDITIVDPKTLEEAARVLDLLSGVDSVLRRLMTGIARETTLVKEVPKNNSQHSLFERVKRSADATASDIQRIAPPGLVGSLAPKENPELWVNNRFAAIREFVNGSGKDSSSSPMLQAVKRLEDLRGLLMIAIDNKRNGLKMPETRLATELEHSGEEMPEPFRGILKTVATKSAGNIKTTDQQRLNSIVRQEVTSFCKKAIDGRYPFNYRSRDDIVSGDFAALFGPNGSIERFRQEQGEGAKLSDAFNQARVIRDVFFRNGNTPQITFTIKPLIMDATITVLRLNIGDQVVRYDHGPRVPTSVTWPSGGGSQNVIITLVPDVEKGTNSVSETGLWALHRLFDKYAVIEPGATSDVFNIVLNIGERKATFEIRASGVYNPFRLPELNNFECPTGML